MTDPNADQLTEKRCRELGITSKLLTWQAIKEWLWDNHQIHIRIIQAGPTAFTYAVDHPRERIFCFGVYANPIKAEIEGVMRAIEFLHEKVKIKHIHQ